MASPATTPSTSHLLKYKSGIHYTLVTGMTPLNSKVATGLKNKKRMTKFVAAVMAPPQLQQCSPASTGSMKHSSHGCREISSEPWGKCVG